MSKALKHKDFLTLLSKSKNSQRRKQLISLATPEELKAVEECILNIVRGNLTISRAQRQKLQKYKKALRKITDRTGSKSSKKKILRSQQGGFLPTLLPIALSALTSIVPALFGK
jgi:Trp operon repressor